jgi:hypothetical protein
VASLETAGMKALLAPVMALEVLMFLTIINVEVCELTPVEHLWIEVPHQVCQFYVLHDAFKPPFEAEQHNCYGVYRSQLNVTECYLVFQYARCTLWRSAVLKDKKQQLVSHAFSPHR